MDDNSQYLDIFFEETDETLVQLNDLVLTFEQNPEDMVVLNEIFRAAHTLKGMAGTMGFNAMTEVTHKLENVFTELKDETIRADGYVIDFVFKSLDALADIVEDLRKDEETTQDFTELFQMSEEIVDRANNQEESTSSQQTEHSENEMVFDESDWTVIETALMSDYNVFNLSIFIDENSFMVNARTFLVISKLEEIGELVKTNPTIDILETEEYGHTFSCVLITEVGEEEVNKAISNLTEIEQVIIKEVELRDNEGEVSQTDQKKESEEAILTEDIKKAESAKQDSLNASTRKLATQKINQSIRVDIDKLDTFMNLVSELVIYRTQLEEIGRQTGNKNLEETLSHVSRITNELQSLVLNIRMQPLHTVTSRFSRVVRDLSNDSGKPMKLVIEGEDTELDRTIVSELSEPLIHLIRNSADHGIEDSETRKSLGKDETGTISISAYQEGNRVFITVSDDGKGLDVESIKKSVQKKGLDTQGLSDEEIQALIFDPGFSTSETVTKISGRGVGMDVVRTKIQELGGSIDIKSVPNEGTALRLSLPLTLSIIPALLVKVEGHEFAVPLSVINRALHVQADELRTTHHGQVLLEEDKAIPVVHLERHFDLSNQDKEAYHMVMVTIEGQEYALSVDSIIGQQEIVIVELGNEVKGHNNYLGAAIMGDGRILLILNVTAICLERNKKIND